MPIMESDRVHQVIRTVGWVLLALESVLAIVVTGVTGSAATGFRDNLHCDAPDKLNYNLALVIQDSCSFLCPLWLISTQRKGYHHLCRHSGSIRPQLVFQRAKGSLGEIVLEIVVGHFHRGHNPVVSSSRDIFLHLFRSLQLVCTDTGIMGDVCREMLQL